MIGKMKRWIAQSLYYIRVDADEQGYLIVSIKPRWWWLPEIRMPYDAVTRSDNFILTPYRVER